MPRADDCRYGGASRRWGRQRKGRLPLKSRSRWQSHWLQEFCPLAVRLLKLFQQGGADKFARGHLRRPRCNTDGGAKAPRRAGADNLNKLRGVGFGGLCFLAHDRSVLQTAPRGYTGTADAAAFADIVFYTRVSPWLVYTWALLSPSGPLQGCGFTVEIMRKNT
jgi:hypothetical protein